MHLLQKMDQNLNLKSPRFYFQAKPNKYYNRLYKIESSPLTRHQQAIFSENHHLKRQNREGPLKKDHRKRKVS